MMTAHPLLLALVSYVLICQSFLPSAEAQTLRAGAAAVDVSPRTYPVLINGGMTASTAHQATTPIHARAIALDDGRTRLAIVVVDSCMMTREFLDEAKSLAAQQTGLAVDRILISATHTHSAPASMGCLGTDADPTYAPLLRVKIVEAISQSLANLEPAQVGWAVTPAADYTAVRHWIRRPDRIAEDPFGNPTVRANMHAGQVWDDVTGEGSPEDPDLSLLSIQAVDGRPIAVLANFSMHYFSGETPVSADYFGLLAEGLKQRLETAGSTRLSTNKPSFVGIMSHGCSGDIWRKDYTRQTPARFDTIKIDQYTSELIDLAQAALSQVKYEERADLAMAEARLPLRYRVPDKQRLLWAQAIVDRLGNEPPKTTEEVYAREQVLLHDRQSTEVVVQAIRIGSIALATTPTETYALTGMKLKLQSPLEQTMVIELANGGDGYIPPPEHHVLGGYNTWAARSAGLEVDAEPKIAEACLSLLEQVCGRPRKLSIDQAGADAQAIIARRPLAYYRLNETEGPRARDSSGSNLDAIFEPGVVFFLAGPESSRYGGPAGTNRAAHFAGGRLRARVPGLGDQYSVSMWVWNGMPDECRQVAGWMFGRGYNHSPVRAGEALGLAGQGQHAGQLIFQVDSNAPAYGRTKIPRWSWAHIRLERRGSRVQVFIDDLAEAAGREGPAIKLTTDPEIDVQAPLSIPLEVQDVFIGGRGHVEDSWEGRLDEIVIRQLTR